jgi:hypothetical protein
MCRVGSQLREAGEVRRGRGRVGSFVIRISFELPQEVGVNRILLSP